MCLSLNIRHAVSTAVKSIKLCRRSLAKNSTYPSNIESILSTPYNQNISPSPRSALIPKPEQAYHYPTYTCHRLKGCHTFCNNLRLCSIFYFLISSHQFFFITSQENTRCELPKEREHPSPPAPYR